MGKIFGTDGARGIVGSDLTCELAMNIGKSFAYLLTKDCKTKPMILIGRDTRLSSKMLEAALIAGICSAGADATSLGVVSTPAIAYLVSKYGADAGIMISASHNQVEYNGIKIFNKDGYKISDEQEEKIEKYLLNPQEKIPVKTGTQIGRSYSRRSATADYIAHLVDAIDGDLNGVRVVVDCANGSASATAEQLFRALGANPIVLNAEPDGTNINKDCGSTHIEKLSEFVKEHKCEVGVAFDGDADRCLAVDEKGEIIDGDRLIAIFAKDMKENQKLNNNSVVATVMTNLGFFKFAKQYGIDVQKTKVGDRYVLENMLENDYSLGGEQSGHIIFKENATTGDGQLTAIKLLSILKNSDQPFSRTCEIMEKYPQVLINVDANASQKKKYDEDVELQEYIKELQKEIGRDGRILIRPSGTERYIRIMIEGKDEGQIFNLGEQIKNRIEKTII